MLFRRLPWLVILAASAASCLNVPAGTVKTPLRFEPSSRAVIVYLQGQMLTMSPDGATALGPPLPVLATRTVDPEKGQIFEETWHGDKHHRSLLTLRPNTTIFDARDEDNSFTGTLTFDSTDWFRGGVTYWVQMTDGSGTVTGTGAWKGDTYQTDKVFVDPNGTGVVRFKETLQIIAKETFMAARAAALAR